VQALERTAKVVAADNWQFEHVSHADAHSSSIPLTAAVTAEENAVGTKGR
jgi:hypothetical protein